MGRLRLYAHPDGRTTVHESGFSWTAALLPPFWALQRGLRALAALLFVFGALPGLLRLSELLPWYGSGALLVLLPLGYGWLAAPLHTWWLRRGGWVLTAEEPLPGPRRAP
jgi:hypothetical protein